MSINTIIEEQKKEWSKIQVDNAWKALKMKDFYQQSIKQILEAEVERLKGMKKETKKEDFYYETEFTDGAYTFHKHRNDGYNNAIDDQITHLTNIIKE